MALGRQSFSLAKGSQPYGPSCTASCWQGASCCGSVWRGCRGDALLQQPGADLVAVVPFVSHQGGGVWQIPQQEVSTGEVTALPLAEVKPYRPPLLVVHHVQLAGQPLLGCDQSREGQRPLLEAGGPALGFDGGGIQQQHRFCLCVGGSPIPRRAPGKPHLPSGAAVVGEGVVGSIGAGASTRAPAVTWT